MSRYKYTETEQQMNNVLVYHDQELKAIQEKRDSIDARGTIDASIELLKSLGYEDKVSRVAHAGTKRKRDVIVLRDVVYWSYRNYGGKRWQSIFHKKSAGNQLSSMDGFCKIFLQAT